MKDNKLFLIILAISLAACGTQATPTPEPTLAPTNTIAPTATFEPSPTPEPSFPEGEIKIAVLAPLSGPVPDFGESIKRGAEMAFEEWNNTGGVLGKKIVPILEDSQCSPEIAKEMAKKVIDQDGVHYILGETCSGASIPVSDIAEARGVIQISPVSTNERVTIKNNGSTKQYVFRACFIDAFQASAAAKFAWEKGLQSAFVMSNPSDNYSKSLASEFIKTFKELGGVVVGNETYKKTENNFGPILQKAKESNADVTYLPDYYANVNLIAAQAIAVGLDTVIIGGDGWSRNLDLGLTEGYYFTSHYALDDKRSINQDFIRNYSAKYSGQPDDLAALSYDATNLLLEAIKQTGVDDPKLIKDVLASIQFEGVTGMIRFDAAHNPIKDVVVMGIRNGKVVYITSVTPD